MMLGPSGLRRNIARAGRVFLLLLLALTFAVPYWGIVRSAELTNRPENVRPLDEEARTVRGRILDVNGVELARSSVQPDGRVQRVYTYPSLAPVTGYWSLRYDTAGIEAARNDVLRGRRGLPIGEELTNALLHRPSVGSDVVLTIDTRIQRVADAALGQNRGAMVVMDVQTGAIVALASHPFYDPNRLDQDIDRLRNDPGRPFVNKATQGLYTPGSTFKTVTLVAALEKGIADPTTVFTYTLRPPDAQHSGWWHVSNLGYLCENHPTNNSPFNLVSAFAWSCNVAFGQLGLDIGPQDYQEVAQRFGIGRPIPFDLPTSATSLYTRPDYFTGDERFYALASTAFGQGELSMSPLQMALITAAVANQGRMPRPYLVARLQGKDGDTIEVARPRTWATVMSSTTAEQVRKMMVTSGTEGWARTAAVRGTPVGGKTGTAEPAEAKAPHSWFIGFVPGDRPRYAVATVLENAGFGSAQAAPATKQVFEALLALP